MLLHIPHSSGYKESLQRSLSRKRDRTLSLQIPFHQHNQSINNLPTSKFGDQKPIKKKKKNNKVPSYMPEMTHYQKILQKYF